MKNFDSVRMGLAGFVTAIRKRWGVIADSYDDWMDRLKSFEIIIIFKEDLMRMLKQSEEAARAGSLLTKHYTDFNLQLFLSS